MFFWRNRRPRGLGLFFQWTRCGVWKTAVTAVTHVTRVQVPMMRSVTMRRRRAGALSTFHWRKMGLSENVGLIFSIFPMK